MEKLDLTEPEQQLLRLLEKHYSESPFSRMGEWLERGNQTFGGIMDEMAIEEDAEFMRMVDCLKGYGLCEHNSAIPFRETRICITEQGLLGLRQLDRPPDLVARWADKARRHRILAVLIVTGGILGWLGWLAVIVQAVLRVGGFRSSP